MSTVKSNAPVSKNPVIVNPNAVGQKVSSPNLPTPEQSMALSEDLMKLLGGKSISEIQNILKLKEEQLTKGKAQRADAIRAAFAGIAVTHGLAVGDLVTEVAELHGFKATAVDSTASGTPGKRGKSMSPEATREQNAVLRFISIEQAKKSQGFSYVESASAIRRALGTVDSSRINLTIQKLKANKLTPYTVNIVKDEKGMFVRADVSDSDGNTITDKGEVVAKAA